MGDYYKETAFWAEQNVNLLVARYRAEHHLVSHLEVGPVKIGDEVTMNPVMGISVNADYAMDFDETEDLLAIRAEQRDAGDH